MKQLMVILEKYWVWVALAAGALTYGSVMLLAAGQSVWFDEGYSILLAKLSFGELLALTAVDAHPPFYYLLLKVWGEVFGFGEFALRSLSAVLAGGVVTSALLLVRRMFGVQAGLVSLGVLLLAPFLLRYGYEVRMYSLATLIGVGATYALVRAREGGEKARYFWGMYAVLVALGMYTLYMMLAVWLAHVVWLTVQSVRAKQPFRQWRWMYAYVAAVALFIPYIPTFFYQLSNSALPGIGNEVTPAVLADTASVLLLFTPEWQMGGWLTILLIALIAVLAVIGVKAYRQLGKKQRPLFMLLVALASVPMLFYALTSLPPREPIFVVRYMAHAAVWVYLLMAVIIALGWRHTGTRRLAAVGSVLVAATLALGVVTLADKGNFVFERMQKPMTQELRTGVDCNSDTTIVANDPYTYIDAIFYFEDCDVRFYAESPVEKKGGYAPLHDSDHRIADSDGLQSREVVYLHWGEPSMEMDARYRLSAQHTYGKQQVSVYTLSEE